MAVLPAVQALSRKQIPVMALKGTALTLSGLYSVGERASGDVDLLVPAECFAAALDLLLEHGWMPTRSLPRGNLLRLEHAVDLSREGAFLDLHGAALFECRWSGADDGLWQRAAAASFLGETLSIPHAADALLLTCVHGSRRGGSPPRWPTDLARLVPTLQAGDWDVVLTEARQRRVTVPLFAALDYGREQLGLNVPREVLAVLAGESVPAWLVLDFLLRSACSPGHLVRRAALPLFDYWRGAPGRNRWGGWWRFLAQRWGPRRAT